MIAIKKIVVLICFVIQLTTLENTYGQTAQVFEDFDSYRIQAAVDDFTTKFKAAEDLKKFNTELIMLDTLLYLGKTEVVLVMQKFGFFENFSINGDTYLISLTNEKEDFYKELVDQGKIWYIPKLEREGKLFIRVSSTSFMQIAILPDIRGIAKNNDYEKLVAKLYLEAIENRIKRSDDLRAVGFDFSGYLQIEKRSLINTYAKMINYRANFLNFLFTKYHVN